MVLLSALVSAMLGLLIGKLFFGIDLATLAEVVSNPQSAREIAFVKFYQLINQLGVFIVPVVIYSFFVTSSTSRYLSLNKSPNATNLFIMGLVVFTILPFINFLGEVNQQITLPETFSGVELWMLEKEEQARHLTEIFLKTSTISGLLINLFIMALVPAIGEELLFRGVVLRLFREMTNNVHLAVIISAILFAALHFQFYGFLPRFFLGVILGYSFVITQNLWVPIFIHLVNNAASVTVFYLHHNGYLKVPMEDFGATQQPVYIIGSLLISIWLMIMVYHREGTNRT
jgi:membrane protease YdiL (CAAX protease family)